MNSIAHALSSRISSRAVGIGGVKGVGGAILPPPPVDYDNNRSKTFSFKSPREAMWCAPPDFQTFRRPWEANVVFSTDFALIVQVF